MKQVTPEVAVAAIPDNSIAVMPGGCAQALALYDALLAQSTRFKALTLCSGFSFGSYRYLEQGLGEGLRYVTWQASPRIKALMKEADPRKVGFVPIRLGDVHRVVANDGEIRPDTVVIQTSPPLPDGTVSLGVSVGATAEIVHSAKLVIAEFNPNMPVTGGDARVPLEVIDFSYESDDPICEYHSPSAQQSDHDIVQHVMSLVPDNAWVQLGIGSVPDKIMECLSDVPGINLWSGLLTGGLSSFVAKAAHSPRIVVGELAGDRAFYDFCHDNQRIEMASTALTHDVAKVAALPKFVSINSALEVDLMGQSNGEAIGNVQISGVGGSLDYIEAAALSSGGVSVIAMGSTTADGKRSKIVSRFEAGAVVTTPRYCTDYVVTEFGIARLRGKDLYQRAQALIEIAHPDFRDSLTEAIQ